MYRYVYTIDQVRSTCIYIMYMHVYASIRASTRYSRESSIRSLAISGWSLLVELSHRIAKNATLDMSSALALLNEVLPRPEAQACSCTWFLGRYWLAIGTGHSIHLFDEAETQTSCPLKRQRGIPARSRTRHAQQQQQQVLPMPDRVACTAWCSGSAVLAGAVKDEVHVFVPSGSSTSERANSVTWVLSAVIQLPRDASIAAMSWAPSGAWLVAAGSTISVCALPEQVVSAAAVGGTVTSLVASWSVRLCPGHTNSTCGAVDNISGKDKAAVSSQKYVSTPSFPTSGKETELDPHCAAVLCACGAPPSHGGA